MYLFKHAAGFCLQSSMILKYHLNTKHMLVRSFSSSVLPGCTYIQASVFQLLSSQTPVYKHSC